MTARAPDEIVHSQKGTYTVAQLRARCRVIEPGIVYFIEIPHGTREAFEILMDTVRELGAPFGKFVLIVDLAEATRPKPDLVEYILKCARTVGVHWCTVQPGNAFMRAVTRFVLARMVGLENLSVHDSLEEATAAARAVLRKTASASA